jgi:hypothetical protein
MRSPPSTRSKPPALAQATTSGRDSQEDLREYLAFLDDTNLSEAQKIELLQTLWSIMSAFVDLAFGTDPVQQALPSIAATQRTDDSIVSAVTPAEQK